MKNEQDNAQDWVSNCCSAPVMGEVSAMGIGSDMFGRCSCCKEMAQFISLEDEE